MGNLRLTGLALLVAMSLLGVCISRVSAQMNPAPAPTMGNSTMGNQGGQQSQTTPATPSVVAAPGSTVVVQPNQPSSNSANGGLIVAAPGSTVVVQSSQPAANAGAKTNTPASNTFTSSDKLNVINQLISRAKGNVPAKKVNGGPVPAPAGRPTKLNALVRAGAIDALGLVGGDSTAIDEIVRGLSEVLDQEFIDTDNLAFKEADSEFICFHVVQALGKLGWGAKCSISQMQMLRGQNVILDAAIDSAITAIKNGSPPPQPQPPPTTPGSGTKTPTGDMGMGNMNMGNMNQGNQPGGNPMPGAQ